ncbi:MAG: S-ribosylhomocysteine lyase [Ruminococcaceae bacterium]|nr:S-ribosylhomocysteine lyase [Oscillospiraceae bacterium]
MKTIASFMVDHTKLEPGLYLSRVDGDVNTYDLRFIKPNTPPFMDTAAMHTIEHLFATLARNSEYGSNIIYFGPMGCRTGFYLLTRGMSHRNVIELVIDTVRRIAAWDAPIPGTTAPECGNYLEHDLPAARILAESYAKCIVYWTADMLEYIK